MKDYHFPGKYTNCLTLNGGHRRKICQDGLNWLWRLGAHGHE